MPRRADAGGGGGKVSKLLLCQTPVDVAAFTSADRLVFIQRSKVTETQSILGNEGLACDMEKRLLKTSCL